MQKTYLPVSYLLSSLYIFSGLFWVGDKAIDLGLADGIGSITQILQKKLSINTYFR